MVNMVGVEYIDSDRNQDDSPRNNIMAVQQLPENHIRASLLRNIPDEIRGLPYFYPRFTDSKAATKHVEEHSQGPGYFLLRLSSKGDNFLSLSVSIENRSVRHVNVVIERSPSLKYFIVQQVKFSSFLELQRYYTNHRICNLEQIENVKLLCPINRGFDDINEYERVNSMVVSPAVPIGRRPSDVQMPKTPSASQLTGQWPDPEVSSPNNGTQYLPSTPSAEHLIRRRSSSRPLPRTPGEQESAPRDRPPCPAPPAKETDLYYSRPRDTNRDRINELKQILRDAEICDCGVPLCDSELPQGWTLHKSHDPATFGCLFYQSSRGETTWNLPLQIVPEITTNQRNIIVKLSHQSGKPPPKCLLLPYPERDPGRLGLSGSNNSISELQGAEGRHES